MRSRHEAKIVRGAQRFLAPGETVVRALVAVPRGTTQRMAGEPTIGTAQTERAIEAAARADVRLATPMGLVLTTRRLLVAELSTAYGLGLGGDVRDVLSAIPLADVDEIAVQRLVLGQTITLTVRGESFKLEANALACGRDLARAFARARA